jgi:hypothetical protein
MARHRPHSIEFRRRVVHTQLAKELDYKVVFSGSLDPVVAAKKARNIRSILAHLQQWRYVTEASDTP